MKTGEEFVTNAGSKLATDAMGNQWDQKSGVGSDYIDTSAGYMRTGLEAVGSGLHEGFPNLHVRFGN